MAEIIPINQHKENFNDSIKILSELCREDLHSVNTLILEKLDSSVPLIKEIGTPPIIIDAEDLLRNPKKILFKICKNLKIKFDDKMLSWPPGIRETDGIWGKHWYKQVENSTGFNPYIKTNKIIPLKYQSLYDECIQYYNFLYQNRIVIG